jgi:hypothetical protein
MVMTSNDSPSRQDPACDWRFDALRVEAELARIDREWEVTRRRHFGCGEAGEPTGATGLFLGIVFVAFGLTWYMSFAEETFQPMSLAGLLLVGLGVWVAITSPIEAGRYYVLRDRHERRRQRLLARLEEIEEARHPAAPELDPWRVVREADP